MRDMHDLQNALTHAFVRYQWRLDNPMPFVGETEEMRIRQYLGNPIFHAKVDTLTAGVLDIVQTWLGEQDDNV